MATQSAALMQTSLSIMIFICGACNLQKKQGGGTMTVANPREVRESDVLQTRT